VSEPQVTLEENDQIRSRLDKRAQLEAEGVDVYPTRFPVTHTTAEALAAFETGTGANVAVAGRLVSRRKMGKATFLHLQDRTGRLQLYFKKDVLGDALYDRLDLLDLGDFLGVEGEMFRTKMGEISVAAKAWTFLGKSLRPLPEKWHGLVDKELRFRQRYLDLLVNESSRNVFLARTRMVSAMRRVLDERGFLEVETPILQPIYGGASARPFRTTHHALDISLYLRIANELYLKRCLVGGLERVYEFGKDFRNEGMDRTHQPEFTQMEAYQAYANYEAGMELTEALLAAAAMAANGSLTCVEGSGDRFHSAVEAAPVFRSAGAGHRTRSLHARRGAHAGRLPRARNRDGRGSQPGQESRRALLARRAARHSSTDVRDRSRQGDVPPGQGKARAPGARRAFRAGGLRDGNRKRILRIE
jgi:lysyl-tRNA synthetase class 2